MQRFPIRHKTFVRWMERGRNPEEHGDVADVGDRPGNNEQNGSQRPPGGDHGNPLGNGDGRTAAHLSDEELLAMFPGSTILQDGDFGDDVPVHECSDPAHRALGHD